MNEMPMVIEICLYIMMICVTAVFVALTIHLYMSLVEDWREWKEEREDNNETD